MQYTTIKRVPHSMSISTSNVKKALITGITGQDGSYLAEFLLEKGYEVHGTIRRSSSFNTGRINHIFDKLILHYADITDPTNLVGILSKVRPDEVYNLAAQSHVKVSFEQPDYTSQVDALGVLRLLEAIRITGLEKTCRLYQASTSEMYGKVHTTPQNETTPFNPRSPYGIAKVFAHQTAQLYREAYGMFVSCGILFNHEGPRRGRTFVTRKVCRAVAEYSTNPRMYKPLKLGNLDARRDWGDARDYVKGMWLMLQQDKADDFVLATNTMYTVRDLLILAFKVKNVDIQFKGQGIDEVGYDARTGQNLVCIDTKYFRPAEVDELCGDYTKAKRVLNWEPMISFEQTLTDTIKEDEREILKGF